jgi:hypothetical protein
VLSVTDISRQDASVFVFVSLGGLGVSAACSGFTAAGERMWFSPITHHPSPITA